jgi:hypothetical protein
MHTIIFTTYQMTAVNKNGQKAKMVSCLLSWLDLFFVVGESQPTKEPSAELTTINSNKHNNQQQQIQQSSWWGDVVISFSFFLLLLL